MRPALDNPRPASSTREDCLEQLQLIECYRQVRSLELGCEFHPEVAATEWVASYAAAWRRYRESRRMTRLAAGA